MKKSDKVKLNKPIQNPDSTLVISEGYIKEIIDINDLVKRILVHFPIIGQDRLFESNGSDPIYNTSNLQIL